MGFTFNSYILRTPTGLLKILELVSFSIQSPYVLSVSIVHLGIGPIFIESFLISLFFAKPISDSIFANQFELKLVQKNTRSVKFDTYLYRLLKALVPLDIFAHNIAIKR